MPRRIPVSEPVVVLGRERASGKLYALRHAAFQRGVHIQGAIGAGKTSLLLRYLVATGTRLPWVLTDFIGTGHRHLQAWIAHRATMLAIAERRCPELAGRTARFLARFAFLTIGDPNPAVRVDLLRRRTLPDGSRESVRDVTGRALDVFFTKLNDPDAALRVRFRRICTSVIAVLVGADRPITEALRVFDDPYYILFLERELSSRRFRRSDHRFLTQQLSELHHVLALRPTDPTKSWRAFEEMTESTRNALADFAPGTLLGDLFGAETFPLEDIAFGRTSLAVSTRFADDTLKSQAFLALHSMLHGLFLHRPDVADLPPLTYIADEPRWIRRNFPGVLAVSRNLDVSYVIAHQARNQFLDLGLPTLPDQLRALTNLQIAFRPTCFADAEDEILHTHPIRPDGLVQRFTVASWGEGTSDAYSVRSAWDDFSLFGHRGDTTATSGSSDTHGEHESLNVVGFQDQVRYRAQVALQRPRFTGSVILDGIGTEVTFAPAPVFPETIAGVPILKHFRAAHDQLWRARLIAHSPYDPRLALFREETSTPSTPALPASEPAVVEPPATAAPAPLNLPDGAAPKKRPRRRARGRGKGRDA